MTVIDMEARRAAKHPHQTGEALCLHCEHEWTAVAPVGTQWLECPLCKVEKGVFRGASKPNAQVLTCDCGNQLHYVTPDGAFCPNCGTTMTV